jgi:hypothetical protein
LVIDELPLLIQSIVRRADAQSARELLMWFRSVRQNPGLSRLRWVVGGSIGIEHILEYVKAGTKAINDLEVVKVGPFTEDIGRGFITELLKNEGGFRSVDPSVCDCFLKLIGAPVPYYLQILAKESLYGMARQKKKMLDCDIIEKAYREEALGPASRTYFEHFFSRLTDYYDETRERVAKRLILEVARRGTIERKALFRLYRQVSKKMLDDETFSYIMTDLENDFYVTYDPVRQSYGFATNILRDWWLRYYDLVEE